MTGPQRGTKATRLVLFDIGGVVVRICRSFEEATLAAGVPLRDRTSFERTREALGRVLAANELGLVPPGEAHRRMSEAIDGLYAAHEIAAIHAAVLRDEYAGMAAIVAALGDSGVETACLSNTDPLHWEVLETMPALRALRHRHASHLWGLAKPDEPIYRRLEAERGVRGREILFFDDTPANVETARRLGWDAVLVEHAGDPAAQVTVALRERGIRIRPEPSLTVPWPRPAGPASRPGGHR
jgi:HAD superfamily hydrolase (TIGR01509 family)